MEISSFQKVGLVAILMSGSMFAQAQKRADKPNVVFIVADDLGYGDVSCYGAQKIRTPNMDRLAEDGLRFIDAHSVAATSTPSRYSLFTGCYNWRRKDTGIAPGDAAMIITPEQYTIADMFKESGYRTAAVGKWHLGLGAERGQQNWNGKISPALEDLGFDYSYIIPATADRVPCVFIENGRVAGYDPDAPIGVSYSEPFPGEPLGKDHPELLVKMHPAYGHDQAIVNGISRIGYMKGGGKALWKDEDIADSITAKALNFITENRTAPFFLYVGTSDIHVPRYPHARFSGKSGMGYRGDAILQLDWTVGEIVKRLKKEGIYDNTLIVFTSDNGPILNDGYKDQAVELAGDHRPWGEFRGEKSSIYEAGTRVPFIVVWKNVINTGISKALVSHIDLFASMASLLEVRLEAGAASDSWNQLPALLGKETSGRKYIVESAKQLSVSTGEWKYIEPKLNRRTGKIQPEELYHLTDDISEKNNVAAKFPEKLEELKNILEKEKSRTPKTE